MPYGNLTSTLLLFEIFVEYEQIFMNLRVGRASALTVLFFALLAMLTLIQVWAFRWSSRGGSAEVAS